MHTYEEQHVTLSVSGEGQVKASDIEVNQNIEIVDPCLLYTSDAADE